METAGGSALQVHQATIELAFYVSVGLARFPFCVAHRWGRTAADVLLSDCQYHTGTALYGRCGAWNAGDE